MNVPIQQKDVVLFSSFGSIENFPVTGDYRNRIKRNNLLREK